MTTASLSKSVPKLQSKYAFKIMKSPVGDLKLVASDNGLAAVVWVRKHSGSTKVPAAHEDAKHPVLQKAEKQLTEYFAGTRTKFDLKLDLQGTEFQKKVWKALLAIPCGTTVSYADIARKIGKPKAVRAVGNANNRNPICIVAACHRVISSSGKLAGYAGGLDVKAALLTHESIPHPRHLLPQYSRLNRAPLHTGHSRLLR
jgi:methylated-DNA-[protein]-cysteine S-methyltransferase